MHPCRTGPNGNATRRRICCRSSAFCVTEKTAAPGIRFRHPNIFASSAAENAGINSWDALKNKEKGRTTLADELNTVPATLPALMYAQKMQKRAARKGAFAQTAEDAAAALKAAERGWEEAVPENAAERAGALLFAAANAMRLAGVDAEEALTFASGRFRQELLQKTEDSDGQERPATV